MLFDQTAISPSELHAPLSLYLQDLSAQDSMFALELVAVEAGVHSNVEGPVSKGLHLHLDPEATGLDAAAASLAASQQAVAAGWGLLHGHVGSRRGKQVRQRVIYRHTSGSWLKLCR